MQKKYMIYLGSINSEVLGRVAKSTNPPGQAIWCQFCVTKWMNEKLSPYPYYKIYNSQTDRSCFECMTYIFYVLHCLVEWLHLIEVLRKACLLITRYTTKQTNKQNLNTREVKGKVNRNNLSGLGDLGKSCSFGDTKFCKNRVTSFDKNILPLVWGDMWLQFYYLVM